MGKVRSLPGFGVALGAAVAVVLLFAPSVGAAQTFGNNLSAPADTTSSPANAITVAHDALPPVSTAPGGVTSPINGVIVRWRIKMGNMTTPVALRVTRPGNSSTRTGVGTSATVTPPINTTWEFATQLPVQAGDALGVNYGPGNFKGLSGLTGVTALAWNPALADGEPPRAGGSSPFELLVNADVEPDCDNDGFGDETQDPDISSCNPPPAPAPVKANRSLALDANKNKVEEGKKVTLTGRVTEVVRQACQSGQTVDLQRRKPSQSTFTTIAQLQTDAGGSFSAKLKVKKTFEYRAQVGETDACLGGVSNVEKVKVKKKK
jgi:hypothetical protein